MEQADDKKMIAEMKSYLSDRAKANKSADDPKAEENLPFESIDSYSTDPVGFSEMSLRMLSRVEFVFDLAAKENRFSSKYLKRCIQLEKGIKYLGSLCVTKYALQTQGQTFPQLGQLSTEKLYCMTSHHFRKLDQAVSEHMFEHRDVPDKLFDMELRYFNLLERLRSTEVKIEKFHDRYIFGPEDYSPIVHGLAFSEKSRTRSIHKQYDEAPAFRQAPAFSAYGGKLSSVSGQGAVNEEGRMKNEDGVRSRTCEGSDSGANCTAETGTVTRQRNCPPAIARESVISDQGSENEEVRMKNEEQGSVISGQGAVNEEGRMKNEDGVRSRTCEGSDSGANCSLSLNEEVKKVSGVSGQGSENEEVRMKNEDGVRSRTCEGSDFETNCTAETGTVTRQRNCPPAIARESVISDQGAVNEEGRMKNEDGVRSRTCEGSDFETNCSLSLNEEVKKVSGVSGQGSENEEVRMKNEEQGSDNEEAPVSASSPSTYQREQLSKAGTTRKVAEELHKNEERIKEQGARIEEKEENTEEQGPRIEENEDGRSKNEETLPPCLEIMKRVMERSRNSDDHSLTFTFDEMEFLASDPLFARLDPRLAADLRKILEKGPPD